MNMLKNNVTITPDEVAMNVAHIEGKIKELHNVRACLDTVEGKVKVGAVGQTMSPAMTESHLAMKVIKRVMGKDDDRQL